MKVGISVAVIVGIVVLSLRLIKPPDKGNYIDAWDNGPITVSVTCYYTVDGVSRTGSQRVEGIHTESDEYLDGRLLRSSKTLTITDYLSECR